MRNILLSFDELAGNEILSERDLEDYHSAYIDLYNEFRKSKDDEKENLARDETYKYMRNAFRTGRVAATGTDLAKILPPVSRFSPGGERSKKRESVLEKLTGDFERFFDIAGGRI